MLTLQLAASANTAFATPARSAFCCRQATRLQQRPAQFPTARQRRLFTSTRAESSNGTTDTAPDVFKKMQSLRVDLSAFPNIEFFRVEGIVRPWRLNSVVEELSKHGILGMTATAVKGAGVQGGKQERYRGSEHGVKNLVEKSKLDIVVFRTQVNTVVRIIAQAAYTGEIGDGKVFVHPVCDVVRIRTCETGGSAERMEGGMADLLGTLDIDD